MPFCCYDETVDFAWDCEDGAPTSAYFDHLPGTQTNTAGVGISASRGLVSGGGFGYDEFGRSLPGLVDECGAPRLEFAVGMYYKAATADVGAGFWLMEIRTTAQLWIYSLYRDGADLAVFGNGSSASPLYRVSNCFPVGAYQRVEFRGAIESGGFGNVKFDGWVEVRINNRVYRHGDDYAAIDPHAPAEEDPCGHGVSGIGTSVNTEGWTSVEYGFGGDPSSVIDCMYFRQSARYCNERTELGTPGGGTRCPDPGPGGSSFDGVANGPRTVQLGGFPATYTAPTGGGRLPTASDPSDPQTMASITVPIVTLDVTLSDGTTVKRYGQLTAPRSGSARALPVIVRWGDVLYPFSDRFGQIQGQVWEVEVADPDGDLRGVLASGSNQYFKKWEGILYIENDTARQAGTARRKVARGRVVSVRYDTDLTVTLVFSDELTRHDSAYSLDQELPHVLIADVFGETTTITGATFVQLPSDETLRLPMPILLGECSDQWRVGDAPPVTPIGICQLIDVGTWTLADGNTYAGFAVSLYACKGIVSLFGSNMDPTCPSSVQLDPEVFSTGEFLVPGLGSGTKAWSAFFATNYLDVTYKGVTYRVSMIFGRGPRVDAMREGKVPLSANVLGVESTGDTTGTLIDDLAYLTEFVLEHPVLRKTTTGAWGSYAAFADGTSKVRHTTFTATKAIHDARVSTGYKGALQMYERRSAREWLAELLVSADLRLGLNHHGQVIASTLNDTATLTGLTTYRDGIHIQDGSFRITSELNGELENAMSWDAGPEKASGRTTVAKETTTSAQAVTNWGDTYKAREHQFAAIYRVLVARDLVGRRLLASLNGITRGEFVIDLAGGDLTQGQLIRSTDYRGIGTTGWTDRLLRVTERLLMLNPDDGGLSVRVSWEDVHRQLVGPGGYSAIGFHPVGNAATGTAPGTVGGGWVVGNASDGTAWRVA